MKKCKTCKHWNYQGHHMGKCTGIFGEGFLIPIHNQPKGKANAKLISTEGIIATCSFVTTTENWNCKNWRMK
jgi:hypothetical protein